MDVRRKSSHWRWNSIYIFIRAKTSQNAGTCSSSTDGQGNAVGCLSSCTRLPSTAQHESVSSPHGGGTKVAKITDFDRTIRKARHHLQLPTHRLNMTAQG